MPSKRELEMQLRLLQKQLRRSEELFRKAANKLENVVAAYESLKDTRSRRK